MINGVRAINPNPFVVIYNLAICGALFMMMVIMFIIRRGKLQTGEKA
jgi:hypothetical protein